MASDHQEAGRIGPSYTFDTVWTGFVPFPAIRNGTESVPYRRTEHDQDFNLAHVWRKISGPEVFGPIA
jgi:hypothetical protein